MYGAKSETVRCFFSWHEVLVEDMNVNKTQNIVGGIIETHHIDVKG